MKDPLALMRERLEAQRGAGTKYQAGQVVQLLIRHSIALFAMERGGFGLGKRRRCCAMRSPCRKRWDRLG